jgi:hypothetical protein
LGGLGMLAESYLDLSAATMGPAPTLAVLFNPFCLFTTAQVLALKASLLLLLTLLVKTLMLLAISGGLSSSHDY